MEGQREARLATLRECIGQKRAIEPNATSQSMLHPTFSKVIPIQPNGGQPTLSNTGCICLLGHFKTRLLATWGVSLISTFGILG